MTIETQQDKVDHFEKQMSEFVSELTGQNIESVHTLLAMRTKQDVMCILTQGDPDITIMLALGAIRQVYETKVDTEQMSYELFAESIKKLLLSMDEVMERSQDLMIQQQPS